MNNLLTKEIIRHVFASFGIIPPLGKIGLTAEELLSKKVLKVKYTGDDQKDTEVHHPIYAGQISSLNSKLRAIVIDLTIDQETPEYCLVCRFDAFPLRGLRLSYDEGDFGNFKILNEKNMWIDAPISIQAQTLMGAEQIVSIGFIWEPCDQLEDLHKAAALLVY